MLCYRDKEELRIVLNMNYTESQIKFGFLIVFLMIFSLGVIDFRRRKYSLHDQQPLIVQSLGVNVKSSKRIENIEVSKLDPLKALNANGIVTFYNVCVEELQVTPVVKSSSSETKTIVIYNIQKAATKFKTAERRLRMNVSGSGNTPWNHWDIEFRNESIPDTHRVLPTTAFFIAPTQPSNLHHFWQDEFIGLYSVVRATNRLHPRYENQILYRSPPHAEVPLNKTKPCDCCVNWSRYDDILRTLYTTCKASEFYNMPANTCYSSGVFGTAFLPSTGSKRSIVDHVLKGLSLSYRNTSITRSNITIIQRTHRRILNAEDLANGARAVGFKHVQLLNFEDLSVTDQVAVVTSTDILVGVQGAALQWAIFMRPKSTAIEIIWPQKYWNSYFSFVRNYDIQLRSLTANDVRENWRSFELNERGGRECSSEERARLLNNPPKVLNRGNIWKYADVNVDVSDFQKALKKLQ